MKTLKTELAKFIDGDELDVYGLQDALVNWPKTESNEDNEEPLEEEPLDLENYEILSIDDTKMVMCCGGDWQVPMKLIIELVQDKLTVTSTEHNFFEEGLDSDEILHILTK